MSIDYPAELQARFERRIVEGAYGRGQVIRADHLAEQLEAPVDQVWRILRTAQRKGLVADAAEEAVRVLGLPTTQFASVFTHTASSGLKPRSEVRQVEVEPATSTVAQKLRIDVGSPVYRYVRTRWVNERALANQTNYMPFEVCPGLEHDDVRRYSFQKLLEEKYAAVLVEMKEEALLVPATTQDQEVLGLATGANVLVVDRIALSATGWPLVWAEIRIRPDRFDYVAALWPEGAKLLQ